MAAEIKALYPSQKVILVHSRERLLSAEPLPDDFKERVASVLQEEGVEVVLGKRVMETVSVESEKSSQTWQITLADKTRLQAGHVINAISKSIPTTSYLPKEVLDTDGYVLIQPSYVKFLQLYLLHSTCSTLTVQQVAAPWENPPWRASLCGWRHCDLGTHQTMRRSHSHGLLRGTQRASADAVGVPAIGTPISEATGSAGSYWACSGTQRCVV